MQCNLIGRLRNGLNQLALLPAESKLIPLNPNLSIGTFHYLMHKLHIDHHLLGGNHNIINSIDYWVEF